MNSNMKTRPQILIALMFAALVGCAKDLETRQVQTDLGLSVFSKGFAGAVRDKTVTDPLVIASGVAVIREWKSASIELEAARAVGDFDNAKFWENRLLGDGTPENPGIVARAATIALNWKAK